MTVNRRRVAMAAVAAIIIVALYNLFKAKRPKKRPELVYTIQKTWDDQTVVHDKIIITLKPGHDGKTVRLLVTAPFFNNPPAPAGKPGQAFPQLWDYEVVEAFFLADSGKYLEVELCPHGQHLVLMLDGQRNMIKDELTLRFDTVIHEGQWVGEAQIPVEYFPPNVTKFNAYAIHGTGEDRQYQALYPAATGQHKDPDFHRLEYFRSINLENILPKDCSSCSSIWKR